MSHGPSHRKVKRQIPSHLGDPRRPLEFPPSPGYPPEQDPLRRRDQGKDSRRVWDLHRGPCPPSMQRPAPHTLRPALLPSLTLPPRPPWASPSYTLAQPTSQSRPPRSPPSSCPRSSSISWPLPFAPGPAHLAPLPPAPSSRPPRAPPSRSRPRPPPFSGPPPSRSEAPAVAPAAAGSRWGGRVGRGAAPGPRELPRRPVLGFLLRQIPPHPADPTPCSFLPGRALGCALGSRGSAHSASCTPGGSGGSARSSPRTPTHRLRARFSAASPVHSPASTRSGGRESRAATPAFAEGPSVVG